MLTFLACSTRRLYAPKSWCQWESIRSRSVVAAWPISQSMRMARSVTKFGLGLTAGLHRYHETVSLPRPISAGVPGFQRLQSNLAKTIVQCVNGFVGLRGL